MLRFIYTTTTLGTFIIINMSCASHDTVPLSHLVQINIGQYNGSTSRATRVSTSSEHHLYPKELSTRQSPPIIDHCMTHPAHDCWVTHPLLLVSGSPVLKALLLRSSCDLNERISSYILSNSTSRPYLHKESSSYLLF